MSTSSAIRRGVVTVVAGAGVFALGATALAGGGAERHKWWLSDEVRAEISLSDQQSRELEAIFESVRPRLRSGWETLERLEQDVSRLMAEGATDDAQVSAAVDRVEAARAALNKTRTLMLFRMYRVLSADQRARLKAFHDRRDRESAGAPRSPSRPR